ncbi:hypothetical protein BGZ80_002747, partial [Entomortierella chlamydospora]
MTEEWRWSINPKRAGAIYFLSKADPPRFCAREYAYIRNGGRRKQEKIITEWASWMNDFRNSEFQVLREASSN